jgi:hypothetical protein
VVALFMKIIAAIPMLQNLVHLLTLSAYCWLTNRGVLKQRLRQALICNFQGILTVASSGHGTISSRSSNPIPQAYIV